MGFVDVPGHERFVRNMVAGVCGIDFALLVVAADDGVMPQTIEHVQILDLLGVRRGMAVMTKVDRVEAARRPQVRRQVEALVAGTSLEGMAVVEASPVTGEGIDAVGRGLRAAAEATPARWQPGRHFRFAVDRAFTVDGSGTVVTGTVFSGEAAAGDRLRISPGGVPARVRRLRVDASDVPRVGCGQRCAINLANVSLAQVARGDWIVADAIHRPTHRLDTRLRLLPIADTRWPRRGRAWSPDRGHLRYVIFAPGSRSVAQPTAQKGQMLGVALASGCAAAAPAPQRAPGSCPPQRRHRLVRARGAPARSRPPPGAGRPPAPRAPSWRGNRGAGEHARRGPRHGRAEPRGFEQWLLDHVEASDNPGAARAMARTVLDEWRLAQRLDPFAAWLEQGAPSEDRRAG